MSRPDPRPDRPAARRIPVSTWIGIGGTALLALIGLVTSGVWLMLALIALVVLFTAAYGWAFRRHTWLRLPRKRTVAALGVALALVLFGTSTALASTHPMSDSHVSASSVHTMSAQSNSSSGSAAIATHSAAPKHTPSPTPTPLVTTKLVTETSAVPFTSTTTSSATLAKGVSRIAQAGVNGVDTKTWSVTYTNGVESGRVLKSDTITTQPVQQVTEVGTYVAPPPAPPVQATCTNGTYVNSAGNTVCSPETSSNAPAGATARCVDGTWSFSQSRSGTCSRHGGVAEWL